MATVSQGVLKQIRDEMFSKMQTFPVKYFALAFYSESVFPAFRHTLRVNDNSASTNTLFILSQ